MTRCCFVISVAGMWILPVMANAQFHSSGHSGGNQHVAANRAFTANRSVSQPVQHNMPAQQYRAPAQYPVQQYYPPQRPVVYQQVNFYNGFVQPYRTGGHSHFHYGYRTYPGFYPYVQPQPVVSYTAPVVTVAPVSSGLGSPEKVPSNPAARFRSLEYQMRGDQKMREHQWSEARALYARALEVAPDRAEGRMRLAFCYTSILRFDSAALQMKAALRQDPTIARSGAKLESIFGPGSQMARNAILSKIRAWVDESPTNSDRLFLLAVMLHFNGDPESRQYFEDALKNHLSGQASHIVIFLQPPAEIEQVAPQPNPDGLPKLQDKPVPVPMLPMFTDLRFPEFSRIPGTPDPIPDTPTRLR